MPPLATISWVMASSLPVGVRGWGVGWVGWRDAKKSVELHTFAQVSLLATRVILDGQQLAQLGWVGVGQHSCFQT